MALGFSRPGPILVKSPYLPEYRSTNLQMEVCAKVWGGLNDVINCKVFLLYKEIL